MHCLIHDFFLQLVGCVYVDKLFTRNCWVIQLFGINCLLPTSGNIISDGQRQFSVSICLIWWQSEPSVCMSLLDLVVVSGVLCGFGMGLLDVVMVRASFLCQFVWCGDGKSQFSVSIFSGQFLSESQFSVCVCWILWEKQFSVCGCWILWERQFSVCVCWILWESQFSVICWMWWWSEPIFCASLLYVVIVRPIFSGQFLSESQFSVNCWMWW